MAGGRKVPSGEIRMGRFKSSLNLIGNWFEEVCHVLVE
jgi:hypothetical protein